VGPVFDRKNLFCHIFTETRRPLGHLLYLIERSGGPEATGHHPANLANLVGGLRAADYILYFHVSYVYIPHIASYFECFIENRSNTFFCFIEDGGRSTAPPLIRKLRFCLYS